MRPRCSLLAAVAAILGLLTAPGALAQDAHKIVSVQEIKWVPAQPSVPPGAQVAVLYGDPSKEGMFSFRFKFPSGYIVPPHRHPQPEIATIISGTFRLGMAENSDKSKTHALPAGSFFAFSPGMAHFAFVDEDTVIQLNST